MSGWRWARAGATAASEAADIVIVVDRLDRLAEAIRIARRSRRIALESVVLGIGLSVIGDDRSGVRPAAAGGRCDPPGIDRRGRDPERPARPGRRSRPADDRARLGGNGARAACGSPRPSLRDQAASADGRPARRAGAGGRPGRAPDDQHVSRRTAARATSATRTRPSTRRSPRQPATTTRPRR